MDRTERDKAACDLAFELSRSSGSVRLQLYGTSMVPALWPGDIVTVQRFPFSGLRPGQIAVCHTGAGLVVHRILRIHHDSLTLQGDSLALPDPPIPEAQLLGLVVTAERAGSNVSLTRSLSQRLLSFSIRHSNLCRHLVLRLGDATPFE